MKASKWLGISSFFIFIILLISVSLMYWSDTYSVSHTNRTFFYTEPNKNVLKVDYILRNKNIYDSFIFGSSRVGVINPLKIKNGKYYNMTYSEGIPHEHLLNIELFIKNGIEIKNLLIGIDDFSYQVSFSKHKEQGLTKPHYLAIDESYLEYFKSYYMRFPLSEDRGHIKNKIINSKKFFKLDVSEQKKYYLNTKSKKDYNSREHLENKIFEKPTFYKGNFLTETLEDIKNIKKICTKNSINCVFFINPIHHTTYKFLNKDLFNKFKNKLLMITDFYDFSYSNKISLNNYYWHETSHYRDIVGDKIINRIFNNKCKKFGTYKKANVIDNMNCDQ